MTATRTNLAPLADGPDSPEGPEYRAEAGTLPDVLGVAEQLLSSRVDLARQDAEARLGVDAGGDVTADQTYGRVLEALGAWAAFGVKLAAVRDAVLAGAATGVVDEHQDGPVPPTPGQVVDLVDAAIRRTGALPSIISVWHCTNVLQVSADLSDDVKGVAIGRRVFADLGVTDPVLSELHGHTLAHLYGPVPSLGDAVLWVFVRVEAATGPAAGGAR